MEKNLTIADLAFYYETMRGAEIISLKTYKSNVGQVLGYFGEWRPKDIGPADCIGYRNMRKDGTLGNPASDATVRRELGVLAAICNYAIHHRVIAATDATGIERPPSPPAKDRWLKEGELCVLMDAAQLLRTGDRLSRIERFLWIILMTAARFDAALRLKWSQVDFDTGIIHLNPPGRKQTKKRRASVSMSEELRIIMQRARVESDSAYVLDNTKDIRGDFAKAVALSGLENVTPHVLRHTAATHMARRGVPLWQIAGVLGNTMAVVEANYAHHCPEHTRGAVANIPSPTRR
jgi:integrase